MSPDEHLLADDEHDQRLLAEVHPPEWTNPEPAERYNLVVVGGGPAGLVAAFGAAGLGARVALVERGLLGGDCLNTGCVPSKALLVSAHAAHSVRAAARLGVRAEGLRVDFGQVMERLRRVRADIGPHDGARRLSEAGVDVFLGSGAFRAEDLLVVRRGERRWTLRFARALIATGARPFVPPIPGVAEVGLRTHESLFQLQELPPRLTVIGGGVIGCEMAQAFARLGSQVALVDQAERILPREDPEVAALVRSQLEADGVRLHLGARVRHFERRGALRLTQLEGGEVLEAQEILLAVGRRPNLDLDLEAAGVEVGTGGVRVDGRLQTTNPRIYAAGDVVGQEAFTHAADHHARLVLRNALFFGSSRVDELVVPRVTFTSPEVASVGLSLTQAEEQGYRSYRAEVGGTDRARAEGAEAGFCRVSVDAKGRIVGATVVAEHAGELLAELTLAMTHGLTLGQIASTVHPYPTRSELVFKVASAFARERLTPTALKWSTWLLDKRR